MDDESISEVTLLINVGVIRNWFMRLGAVEWLRDRMISVGCCLKS